MSYEREEYKSAFGHICTGGGASINNSPVNIHIHIHANEASIAQKIGRSICGIFNPNRNITIENATELSGGELQRCVNRAIESR